MKRMNVKVIVCFILLFGYDVIKVNAQEVVAFIDKIVANDREAGDYFGGDGFDSNVSIFGDFAVVGASWEDTDNLGAAYLFQRVNGCTWIEIDKIVAQNTAYGPRVTDVFGQFGTDVKIFGTTIAVSAERVTADGVLEAGAVYIYEIIGGEAVFQQLITAQNESIPGGAPDSETDGTFGSSIDMTADRLIVGARNNPTNEVGGAPMFGAGAAYIYHREGGIFVFRDKIVADNRTPTDDFGRSVSIFGDYAIVGAPFKDGVADETGRAYIFFWNGFEWNQVQELEPSDLVDEDLFGLSVTINANHAGVGSPTHKRDEDGDIIPDPVMIGAVYMYNLSGTVWNFQTKLVPPVDISVCRFGRDIQLWEDRIVIGAESRSEDEEGDVVAWAGSAYTCEWDGSDWLFDHQFSAPDRAVADFFGTSVGMFEDEIIIGASQEDHDDIFPAPGDERLFAGSAYMFEYKILPEIPVIESDLTAICPGSIATLTIVGGDLEDGEFWEWYEDDCDSDPIGTGTSITVSPDVTTTYCARGKAYCGSLEGDCGCITIEVNDGFWHQSTEFGIYDQAHDVATDKDGNVYITGEYFDQTTFIGGGTADETVASGATDIKSYVAKYDNCGNLRWVAWSNNVSISDFDKGASITIDENNQLVYIAGSFKADISFNDAIGEDADIPGPAHTLTGTGERGYVACFNAVNGQINSLDAIVLDNITQVEAITINENNGRIYVGGQYANAPTGFKVFIQRYTPSPTTIGIANWTVDATTYTPHTYLADMDYDEDAGDAGSLWLTGGFRNTLSFTIGSGSLSTGNRDAYIARYIDGAIPVQSLLLQGNANGKMFGEGIAVDEETGRAYFTGHYRGIAYDVFQMIGHNLPSTSHQHAYFLAIESSGAPVWPSPRYTMGSPENQVFGYAVTYKDGKAIYTGTYKNNMWFVPGGPLAFTSTFGLAESHIFVVSYDALTGTFDWRNATTDNGDLADPLQGPSRQIANAIAADDDGHAFIAGGYSYTMGYLSGSPASGDLICSSTAQFETFLMRTDLTSSGALESPALSINNEDMVLGKDQLTIELIPNPAIDHTVLNLINYQSDQNYQLRIIGLDGKVVFESAVNQSQFIMNISDFESGIYIIDVKSEQRNVQAKLIKNY